MERRERTRAAESCRVDIVAGSDAVSQAWSEGSCRVYHDGVIYVSHVRLIAFPSRTRFMSRDGKQSASPNPPGTRPDRD